jgi:hypothetical protein
VLCAAADTASQRSIVVAIPLFVYQESKQAAHSTVLFACPSKKCLMYYDPHGMYGPGDRWNDQVNARLRRMIADALPEWRLLQPSLPDGGRVSLQTNVALCGFYMAFAVLVASVNPEERLRDVMQALHDRAVLDAVESRGAFDAFVYDVLWQMRPSIRRGQKVAHAVVDARAHAVRWAMRVVDDGFDARTRTCRLRQPIHDDPTDDDTLTAHFASVFIV